MIRSARPTLAEVPLADLSLILQREGDRASLARDPAGRGKSPPDVFPRLKTFGFHGSSAPGIASLRSSRLFIHSLLGDEQAVDLLVCRQLAGDAVGLEAERDLSAGGERGVPGCGSLDVVCAPASLPALANDAVSRGDGRPLHRIAGARRQACRRLVRPTTEAQHTRGEGNRRTLHRARVTCPPRARPAARGAPRAASPGRRRRPCSGETAAVPAASSAPR